MDNKNKKTPRKVHDINTQIEEENLWDLDDDWDDADEGSSTNEAEPEDTAVEPDDDKIKAEESEDEIVAPIAEEEVIEEEDAQEEQLSLDDALESTESEPAEEDESEPAEKAPLDQVDEFDLDDEEELDDFEEPEADAAPEDDYFEEEADELTLSEDVEEDIQEPGVEETEEAPDPSSDMEALVEPLKKLALSSTEKIALSAIALLFVGLTLWGVIWLKQKNNDATGESTLELPVAGSYATITEFTTFWKAPGNATGIKLGAVIVPAASITLDDDSSSGAIRIYFRNASQESVGDPITISFQNGKFENGSNTIEVSASDGFHLKGDFHAYQMDNNLAWEVEVLEADKSNASRSSFKKLFDTEVSPAMR